MSKGYNPGNIRTVLKAGELSPCDLGSLRDWYAERLTERDLSDQSATVYGRTLRALAELENLRQRTGTVAKRGSSRTTPTAPKLPKLNTRQLHVLALVKHARQYVDPIKDESVLLALLDKGALSGWYEITALGEQLLRAQ